MCLARAYLMKNGKPQLIMEDVETMEANENGVWELTGLFGHQQRVAGRIERLCLVDSQIFFQEKSDKAPQPK